MPRAEEACGFEEGSSLHHRVSFRCGSAPGPTAEADGGRSVDGRDAEHHDVVGLGLALDGPVLERDVFLRPEVADRHLLVGGEPDVLPPAASRAPATPWPPDELPTENTTVAPKREWQGLGGCTPGALR